MPTKQRSFSSINFIHLTATMERALRPEGFDTEPSNPNAEKLYKHWKRTLENYLEATIVTPTTTAEPTAQPDAQPARTPDQKKLFCLINSVSAHIYELISDSVSFVTDMEILDAAYIKPASIISNRTI